MIVKSQTWAAEPRKRRRATVRTTDAARRKNDLCVLVEKTKKKPDVHVPTLKTFLTTCVIRLWPSMTATLLVLLGEKEKKLRADEHPTATFL